MDWTKNTFLVAFGCTKYREGMVVEGPLGVDLVAGLLSVEWISIAFSLESGLVCRCCHARVITWVSSLGLVGAEFSCAAGYRR